MRGCGQQEEGKRHTPVGECHLDTPWPLTWYLVVVRVLAAGQPGPLHGPVSPCTLLRLSVPNLSPWGSGKHASSLVGSQLPSGSTNPAPPNYSLLGREYFPLGQNGHICSPGYFLPQRTHPPAGWSFLLMIRFLHIRSLFQADFFKT